MWGDGRKYLRGDFDVFYRGDLDVFYRGDLEDLSRGDLDRVLWLRCEIDLADLEAFLLGV